MSAIMFTPATSRDAQLQRIRSTLDEKRNWLHTNQHAIQEKARDNPLLKPLAKQYSSLSTQEHSLRERQLQLLQRLVDHLFELETSDSAKQASVRVNLKRDKRELEREIELLRAKF